MAERWKSVPRMTKGTVFVLASGPSLKQVEGMVELQKEFCIVVNSSMYIGTWPRILFFGDAKWYWWNREEVQAWPGIRVTLDICWPGRDKSVAEEPGLFLVSRGKSFGLDRRPGMLAFNRSSGAAAINLAYQLGAKRIVLLGFDMRLVDGQRNYVPHRVQKTRVDPFAYMRAGMERLATDCQRAGVEVLNATEGSALEWFPRTSLKAVLDSSQK